MANTPGRHMRIRGEVWGPAMTRARAEGRSLSAVVVEFLAEYGRGGLVTKAGRELTDAEIQDLAAEAERGYDVGQIGPNRDRSGT